MIFMLNQHRVKSALVHSKVIVEIPAKSGSLQMIKSWGLVDSCSTRTFIHPLVFKHIRYKIEQVEESEWKTAAAVVQINEYLWIKKVILPSITISWQLYFPQTLHIMPYIKQLYQIIFNQDAIRAIKINVDVAEGISKKQEIVKSM